MNNIVNNEYYKDLYTNTSISFHINDVNYEAALYSDVIDIKSYKDENEENETISFGTITFYKEAEEVLKLLESDFTNLDKKIIKISDSMDFYYTKVELSKKNENIILTRCDCSSIDDKNEEWISSNNLTFYDIDCVKKFYSILKNEIENMELNF